MIKAAVLTISDKGSRGEREDKSGEIKVDDEIEFLNDKGSSSNN